MSYNVYIMSKPIVLVLCLWHSVTTLCLKPSLRRDVLSRQHNRCGHCLTSFSRMVPHEIHHMNHNPKDDNSSNLLALCANCHGAHHRFGVPVKPFYISNQNLTSSFQVYYDAY